MILVPKLCATMAECTLVHWGLDHLERNQKSFRKGMKYMVTHVRLGRWNGHQGASEVGHRAQNLASIKWQLFSYSKIQVFIFRNHSCFRILSLFSSFLHIQIKFFVFLCETIPPSPPYCVKPSKNRCPLYKPGTSLSPSPLASPHCTWFFSFPI